MLHSVQHDSEGAVPRRLQGNFVASVLSDCTLCGNAMVMPVRMMVLVSQLQRASNQATHFMEGVMASKVTARMLADDREALVGLKTLEDYRPTNEAFSVEMLQQLDERLTRVSEERVRIGKSYEAITAEESGLK
jgi:hypothetical protein